MCNVSVVSDPLNHPIVTFQAFSAGRAGRKGNDNTRIYIVIL